LLMKRFVKPTVLNIALAMVLAFIATLPPAVFAESAVKLHNWQGAVDFSAQPTTPFMLEGTASHLGEFTCNGEVVFLPGETEGSLVGHGVAVFEAANGDLLVGIVTWDVDPAVGYFNACRIHFSWRDSVEFSDGTIVLSTGRFA